MAKKKYIVQNPNNLPPGIVLIAWQSPEGKAYQWKVGESFVPPKRVNIERLLRDGHIVEVADG